MAFAVLAVVLFVAAVLPTNAVVTSFVSTALHLSLGLGAYLLPFLLLIIGASFLARFDRERVPVRVAVGLVMIFVAALSLLALFTPESAPDSVDRLFLSDELAARGGYLGAGIAWVGISLFGQAVTCIIMIGIVLAGLVIIGFSVSKLVERVQDARRALVADDADDDVLAAPPYARMKRSTGAKVPVVPTTGEVVEAGATNVLPRAKDAKGRPSKPRRASQSLVTQAIGNRAASTEEGGGEAPQTLTRKLGRKHDKSDSSPAAPKPSASSTPLASPRPADGFVLPPADLLAVSKNSKKDRASDAELADTAACLQETLESFAIMAEVVGWVAGPTVTLFKVDLPAGVRVSRITALEQDIALALAAPGVRIFAPIPGTNYVGIEVPNRTRQSVLLGDVIKDADEGPLQIVIGKDVEGRSIVSDLAKMPHLLIGGTTGSGKSVSINAMIMSILMRATPSEVRFIMIDPKRVEFTPYNGIPHLLVPVVTDPRKAAGALNWAVSEMMRRYKLFSEFNVRDLEAYNNEVSKQEGGQKLPQIVIVIDELADLMLTAGKDVEGCIVRLAQLARAAGIHLIVATQRPSVDVVTGLIKANFPCRISFQVANKYDSRTILDQPAPKSSRPGRRPLPAAGASKPMRVQGAWVGESEIHRSSPTSRARWKRTTATTSYPTRRKQKSPKISEPTSKTCSRPPSLSSPPSLAPPPCSSASCASASPAPDASWTSSNPATSSDPPKVPRPARSSSPPSSSPRCSRCCAANPPPSANPNPSPRRFPPRPHPPRPRAAHPRGLPAPPRSAPARAPWGRGPRLRGRQTRLLVTNRERDARAIRATAG
mgnify:CR=1 FL=1